MKTNRLKLEPKFEPEIGFPVALALRPLARGRVERDLEHLRGRLTDRELRRAETLEATPLIRQAAGDAAALAWATPCPLLVLPTLFEELLRRRLDLARRQQDILARSAEAFA